jgi:hypothetical protein
MEFKISIPVIFHTNLDIGKRCEWPLSLSCKPQVGDYVSDIYNKVELRVVRVIHSSKKDDPYSPYLKVELNK